LAIKGHLAQKHHRCPPNRGNFNVQAWQHWRNAAAIAADWQFTTKDARIKLRKLYPTIEG